PPAPPGPAHPVSGLRQHHLVVIDPGHGGVDPGNPGRFFPEPLTEKDITLALARLLRAELLRRGVDARLTRAGDTLIDLADRGAACAADCDLFVSIHVNAMPAGRGSGRARLPAGRPRGDERAPGLGRPGSYPPRLRPPRLRPFRVGEVPSLSDCL